MLPQLLASCGVKYLVTQKIFWSYNEGDPFPYHYFNWKGMDGSQVVSFLPTNYTYRTDPKELCGVWKNRVQKRHLEDFLIPFGYGDGGGGPCRVIETAFENGAFFDTWEEYFDYDRWLDAFKTCGIDPDFYNYRAIGLDVVTPWDHLDVGVTKAHLVREYKKALEARTTQPCNRQCSACGANKLIGGPCFDYNQDIL